jgi:signal transduction histidine kinase
MKSHQENRYDTYMASEKNQTDTYEKEQHLAMLNVLEDLNEAQNELQQKYKEVDVIRDLTQNLSTSLDPVTIMRYVADAIQYMFPDVTLSYTVTPYKEAYEKEKHVYVLSRDAIGPQTQETIANCMKQDIEKCPDIRKMKAFSRDDQFRFHTTKKKGTYAEEHVPRSCEILPMVVPGVLNGIIHASASDLKRFDSKTQDIITAIIKNAIMTVSRINNLLESEYARLRDFVHSMADGILRFTNDNRIIVANPAFLSMTQLTDKATLEQVRVLITACIRRETGDSHFEFQDEINQILSGKKTEFHHQAYIYEKGYDIILASVRDDEGQISGGVLILHDITHMKEIDKMKTEFISLASHQLRTPLAAMRWFIEMLLGGDIGELLPEQKEIITNVYQSNERMILLVNALLNISRIESGRMVIDPTPTDIPGLISSVIQEVQQGAELKDISIQTKYADVVPPVSVDPRLIRHVYTNLLTNAIKYTPPKGTITVELTVHKNTIQSKVQDSGYGIPKKDHKRIFQKFFRAQNIQKMETDGTGLGLYLAKMIVQASGGEIWFESTEGKGSTFYFTIPIGGTKPQKGEIALDS